jgi:adenosylmethionine-8-amino-7-oxononanoate aminotransferase
MAFARDRGVLLRPLGNTVYVMPPYSITRDQLDQVWGLVLEFLAA